MADLGNIVRQLGRDGRSTRSGHRHHRTFHRDSFVTTRLLCEQLPCDQFLVVAPYINDLTVTRQLDLKAAGGKLLENGGVL